MSDLISRQAAIDAICKAGCGSGYCGVSCDDVKAIEQLQSVQPERKKGKWRNYPIADGCLQCSSCGVLRMGKPSNYCPNCGAKMDLEGEPHEQN